MSKYISLAGRLRESLVDLEKGVNRAIKLGKQAAKTDDDGYWDGVAFNLDSFYSGVERIFKDIALTVDGSVPEGAEWHLLPGSCRGCRREAYAALRDEQS